MDTPKSSSHMSNILTVTPDLEKRKMEEEEEIVEKCPTTEGISRKCKLSIFPSKHFVNQSTASTINQDTIIEEPELVLHHDDFPCLKIWFSC